MPALTVVGSINVDITAHTSRLPGRGETVGDGVLRRQPGGKGANQAAAMSRLGGTVRMVGAVGADPDGDRAIASLQEAGVDTASVARRSAATGTALVIVDVHGENQIVVCPGANDEVSVRGLTLDDPVLTQLEIPMSVTQEVAAMATGFLAVNTAPARPLTESLVRRADLFIANASEYKQTPELRDAELVAVTDGAKGAVILSRNVEVARAAAPRVTATSTVGAGDAFCAALVLGIVDGLSYEDALRAACSVGADTVTYLEAQPPLRVLRSYL